MNELLRVFQTYGSIALNRFWRVFQAYWPVLLSLLVPTFWRIMLAYADISQQGAARCMMFAWIGAGFTAGLILFRISTGNNPNALFVNVTIFTALIVPAGVILSYWIAGNNFKTFKENYLGLGDKKKADDVDIPVPPDPVSEEEREVVIDEETRAQYLNWLKNCYPNGWKRLNVGRYKSRTTVEGGSYSLPFMGTYLEGRLKAAVDADVWLGSDKRFYLLGLAFCEDTRSSVTMPLKNNSFFCVSTGNFRFVLAENPSNSRRTVSYSAELKDVLQPKDGQVIHLELRIPPKVDLDPLSDEDPWYAGPMVPHTIGGKRVSWSLTFAVGPAIDRGTRWIPESGYTDLPQVDLAHLETFLPRIIIDRDGTRISQVPIINTEMEFRSENLEEEGINLQEGDRLFVTGPKAYTYRMALKVRPRKEKSDS